MLEAYSLNAAVPANTAIPFNSVSLQKGCTAVLSGTSAIQLNKCGVYMVSCDASSGENVTIQLYKNGLAQPQAQSTGGSPCFVTLVQVSANNCGSMCASPTTLQVVNVGDAATYLNTNVCVTKIC
ncbi:MAG: hypothetical protein IJV64_03965 [Oscillospiraceae bacterium]|nr:hypothetical protein [Oscillospiraceae bacterium]